MINSKKIVSWPCVTCLILMYQPTFAIDYTGDFTAGASYSDNIDLIGADGRDEVIAQIGTNINLTENTRTITADFQSSITYYDYLDDTYDDEVVGAVNAIVDVSLIDNILTWQFVDNYGRALFDPFLPARPENLENINLFTTGPTITLYQGARNNVQFNVGYTNMNYEIRPFDNERLGGTLSVGREVRRNHQLSINVDAQKIEFDNGGLTPDFDRRGAFISYEIQTARTDFDIDLGYTEQEILSNQSSGLLFNFSVDRQINGNTQLSFFGGSQFADQGDVFRLQQDISRDIDSIGDLTENGSPFRLNSAGISYSLQAGRTNVVLGATYAAQEFEGQPVLDRDDWRFDFFLSRDFSRALFASVDVALVKRELSGQVAADETIVASVSLGYRFSSAFSTALTLSHSTRNSDTTVNNFDQDRATLLFTYTPSWAR